MAKITRATQKVFGDVAPATGNFGQFGSLAAAAPQYTKDPGTLQALDAWGLGWSAATVGTKSPALEDMNGLFYLTFRQLSYLLQQGFPEYDASTTYYIDGFCAYQGKIYVSKTNDNTGNLPTNTNFWGEYIAKNLAKTIQKTYLFSNAVELLNTSSTAASWTAVDLTSAIASAGLTGKTLISAQVQLKTALGSAGFGTYTASANLSAWGNNTASMTLDCGIQYTADDSQASAMNQNAGWVPLNSNNLYYKSSATHATGRGFQITLLGFIYEDSL